MTEDDKESKSARSFKELLEERFTENNPSEHQEQVSVEEKQMSNFSKEQYHSAGLGKRLLLFFKKGILLTKNIPVLEETQTGFDYRHVTRLTLFNNEIVTHIYNNSPEFVIYDTLEAGHLLIAGNDDNLNILTESVYDVVSIKSRIAGRGGKPFRTSVSGGLRLCLMGKADDAKKIFDDVTIKFVESRKNLFRLLYLFGSTLVVAILFILTWLYKAGIFVIDIPWDESKLLSVLLFASIGGLFSVLLGYRSIKAEIPEAGRFNYIVNGISRIIIAMLAGIVAYRFMEADFIFSNFKDNPYITDCIAIISGFTESFVPGVLKKSAKELEENPN